MTNRILVAVEDDQDRMAPIVECAGEIAGALDAETVLFHAYTSGKFEHRLDEFEFDSADPADVAKRNETVRNAASRLREYGSDPSVHASVGDPAEEIIKFVEENDITHVFLSGRRRSATGKAIFGSVSQTVISSVDVPCTIVMTPRSAE